jgi:nucleoside-diphosphate-sugar epimerase
MNASLASKRVLLTGASGFVGRNCIVPLVGAGFDVAAVGSPFPMPADPRVQFYSVNLLDRAQVATLLRETRPTHLLHLAWRRMPGGGWLDLPESEHRPCIGASLALLDEFAQSGGRSVLFAGTCAEYDWSEGVCVENLTLLRPFSAYGAAKHALHLAAAARAAAAGLNFAWARMFFLYGPHEHPTRLVPQIVRSLLAGAPAPCSHGLQRRDYLYALDAAEALVRLLDAEGSGAFNIGSGQSVRLKDIVTEISRQIGRPDLVKFGVLPASRPDAPLVRADVKRLVTATGWRPRFSLSEGLRQTVSWWTLMHPEHRAA